MPSTLKADCWGSFQTHMPDSFFCRFCKAKRFKQQHQGHKAAQFTFGGSLLSELRHTRKESKTPIVSLSQRTHLLQRAVLNAKISDKFSKCGLVPADPCVRERLLDKQVSHKPEKKANTHTCVDTHHLTQTQIRVKFRATRQTPAEVF